MIGSLMVTDKWKIGVANNKIKTPEGTVSLQNISFIRYNFTHYGEEELEYIAESMKKFEIATHVAQITFYDGWETEVEKMLERFDSLAVFVYVDITDGDVSASNLINPYKVEQLYKIANNDIPVEKVIMRDMSSSLYVVAANKIKRVIHDITGVEESNIGICNSPLSYFDGNACLTAMSAREIAAKYNEHCDCPLPSANHEGKNGNGCGCIKTYMVTSDLYAPEQKAKTSLKKDGSIKEYKKPAVKKPAGKVYSNMPSNW